MEIVIVGLVMAAFLQGFAALFSSVGGIALLAVGAVGFAIWVFIALIVAFRRTRLWRQVKALIPAALVCASIGLLVYLMATGFGPYL